jgi:hypothetical protein
MSTRRAGSTSLPARCVPIPSTSRSRRVQQRRQRSLRVTELVQQTADAAKSLSLSFATRSSYPFQNSNSQKNIPSLPFISSSAAHSRAADFLFSSCRRFDALRGVSSAEVEADLSGLVRARGVVPLVADRVSLPSSCGGVDLLKILPSDISSSYLSPPASSLPVSSSSRPVFTGAMSEYVKLIKRLLALEMLSFTTNPVVVNGLFTVPKDGDKQRLIIDARPANEVLGEPPKVVLPSPDLIADLVVDRDRPLFVAKVDLDNFYHRLRLPDWLHPYFALPAVQAKLLGHDFVSRFGAETYVYPCCTRLPMGWSHSVFLAQAAHQFIIDNYTSLKRCDQLCAGNDLSVSRPRHALYIDDVFFLGHDRQLVAQQQQQYFAAITKVGLVVKWSKVTSPTACGCECLGLVVDGTEHIVGVSVPKLRDLIVQTRAVLSRGSATGRQLSQVVGKWTWACLVRRPLLSVFSSVYRFIERADRRLFSLWPSVVKELQAIIRLAPLMWASLRCRYFPDVIATDASSLGFGVVAFTPERSKLLAAAASPLVTPEQGVFVLHPAIVSLLEPMSGRTIVSAPWRAPEHINSLELRAVKTATKWVTSRPSSLRSSVLLLCDSAVVSHSLNKGRSSSPLLLPRLRAIAAFVLVFGIRLVVRWIPSAANPADAPSRLQNG